MGTGRSAESDDHRLGVRDTCLGFELVDSSQAIESVLRRHAPLWPAGRAYGAAGIEPANSLRWKDFGCFGVIGWEAGSLSGCFPKPQEALAFSLNVFRTSELTALDRFVGFRPFATFVGFRQCNDTRNDTRREELLGFPPGGSPNCTSKRVDQELLTRKKRIL